MGDYSDIIKLSRPDSKRPRMSLEQRSAQFAPFAALAGYDGTIKESARLTNRRIEIDEEIKLLLDLKIQLIQENLQHQPLVEVTYFIPDLKKEGGRYETITNIIKKIDIYKNIIVMENGIVIDIKDIIDIQGEIFNSIFL